MVHFLSSFFVRDAVQKPIARPSSGRKQWFIGNRESGTTVQGREPATGIARMIRENVREAGVGR